MSEFTVTRTLKAPRERVWQVLTQPGHFEGWLPAKPGTAVLDVWTGGSWQATVISSDGDEIALTGRYDEVSAPDRLVMTSATSSSRTSGRSPSRSVSRSGPRPVATARSSDATSPFGSSLGCWKSA